MSKGRKRGKQVNIAARIEGLGDEFDEEVLFHDLIQRHTLLRIRAEKISSDLESLRLSAQRKQDEILAGLKA